MAEEIGATVTGATQTFTATVDGLVPAPTTVTGTKVLADDGTWITPGGGISALTGDVTASGTGSVAATIAAGVVTNSKLADVATSTFKGRTTAGTGSPEDLTVSQAKTLLNLTGTNSGDQTITLTGDVTGSGTGSFAATIAAGVVTNAKLANVATATFKGRTTAGTGSPEDLTVAQAKALLDLSGTNTGDQTLTSLGAANNTLSNLSSPTAINQDLNLDAGKNILLKNNTFINAYKADGTTIVPLVRLDATDVMAIGTGSGQTVRMNAGIFAPTSNGNDLGTSSLAWDIFINNVLSDIKISGTRVIQSIDNTISAPLIIATGTASAGNSGDMTVKTGNSTGGTAGNVVLQCGAVGGVRSNVNILASALDCTGVNSFKLLIPKTLTAGGTTGNQTLSKISGSVNFAAGASSLTVTNTLVDASSIVFAVVRTNDATAVIKNVVPSAGSFVITLEAAATAETSVGFFVLN